MKLDFFGSFFYLRKKMNMKEVKACKKEMKKNKFSFCSFAAFFSPLKAVRRMQ